MELNDFWFCAIGVLLSGYAILDGFDLGAAISLLWCKNEEEKQTIYQSVGPLWDGNEVWLVTFGASFFAAFPEAYATIFSGFYLPLMLLLWALIIRAAAVEFRNKLVSPRWRCRLDYLFALASLLIVALLGITVGALLRGIPVNGQQQFVGSFWDIVTPFSALTGILATSLAMLHGTFFVALKSPIPLGPGVRRAQWLACLVFFFSYLAVSLVCVLNLPHVARVFEQLAISWAIVLITVLAMLNIFKALIAQRPRRGFFYSTILILTLLLCFGRAA